MSYDFTMSTKIFASLIAGIAITGAAVLAAQQKPVSSRTTVVVYKTPT